MNLTVFASDDGVFLNTECICGFTFTMVSSKGEVCPFSAYQSLVSYAKDHCNASHHQLDF